MRFRLIDRVLERGEDRLLAIKQVSLAEEYLQDHFPTFPVLPGVLMLEAMVQAGRELCPRPPGSPPLVLGTVRALKYGQFVKPGASIIVEIRRLGETDGTFDLRGEVRLHEPGSDPNTPGPIAASGRLTLRPVRAATATAPTTPAVRVGSD